MPACHASHVFVEELDSGQRCTQAVTSDPLRALLETWCGHELQWVLHEINAPHLWTQLRRHLRGYLATLWLTGTLRGENPRQAFFVTCDQSTMTAEDIGAGELICVVGLASVKPAEFGLYRINIRLKTPSVVAKTCALRDGNPCSHAAGSRLRDSSSADHPTRASTPGRNPWPAETARCSALSPGPS
jgi:hypothetical protein